MVRVKSIILLFIYYWSYLFFISFFFLSSFGLITYFMLPFYLLCWFIRYEIFIIFVIPLGFRVHNLSHATIKWYYLFLCIV